MASSNPSPSVRVVQTKLRIEVTARDIARAKRRDSGKCAVSTAIARSVPDASHILTDVQTIRFTRGGVERYVFITPDRVKAYVYAFDRGEDLEPMTFELRDALVRPILRRPGVGGRPKGTTMASRRRVPPLIGGSRRRTYGERSLPSIESYREVSE